MKTVFISSTYQDLADHRRVVWQVLEGFDVAVRGMEEFGARTAAPLETCIAEVEQCDVYVGIVAFRLGTVDSTTGKSFTQLEYERAVKLKKPILIYLADEDAARVRYADIEVEAVPRGRLMAFKAVLREKHTVGTFTTPEDLAEKIRRDFERELEARTPPTDQRELDATAALVAQFMLLPRKVVGREIRLRVAFHGGPYPASRSLCRAFNLGYGATVGSYIRVLGPAGDAQRFQEMYATGRSVDRFLELARIKAHVELYARLQFSEQDIRRTHAEFFGYGYYDDPDPGDPLDGDPNERYVSPEGKAMLLFSKTVDAA